MGRRVWSWTWSSQQMVSPYWCTMKLWTALPMARDHSGTWNGSSYPNWTQLLNTDSGWGECCDMTGKSLSLASAFVALHFVYDLSLGALPQQGQICRRENPNSGRSRGGMCPTATHHLLWCQRSPRWGAASKLLWNVQSRDGRLWFYYICLKVKHWERTIVLWWNANPVLEISDLIWLFRKVTDRQRQ